MKKALLILPLIGLGFMAKAQYPKVGTTDSISAETLNWYNQSPDNTKVSGVATTKAYTELLSGKKPTKKVIVAVIDSGVDTDHEDLQGQIWINRKEIPGNGIDDDKNGYIDDIHGWNFLGGTDGKLVVNESLELTRIIRDNKSKFDGKTGADVSEGDKELFKMYKRALKEHEKMMANFSQQKEEIDNAKEQYNFNVKLLTIALGKEDFTLTELEEYKPEDSDMIKAKRMVWFFRSKGIDKSLEAASEQVDVYVNYHLNLDFNGRDASGDDHNDLSDVNYGNNNVEGPEADHGTFVSSLIAAKRGNGIGIDGIATNVEIMAIRAVPKGDEYDKDIARAIRYAVDNGANIINMSFGKEFSPNKQWVDEAMQYASDNNVLLVHAAGNDSKNNDEKPSYPNDKTLDGKMVANWLEVGANSSSHKKDLCGSFSNYGDYTVDLFAPGVRVAGCVPNDKYAILDGTSFSCPVTSGVAALVWSYYPNLTAAELKDILMESTYNMGRKKVVIPGEKKKKDKFKDLSITGGIVNAYNALKLAEKRS